MENDVTAPAAWTIATKPAYGGEWEIEIKAPHFRAVSLEGGDERDAVATFVAKVQSLGY